MKKIGAAETGFTHEEQKVQDALNNALNAFAALERQHPDELNDFITAYHRLQDLMAVRIVRREYPKGWPTYEVKKDG